MSQYKFVVDGEWRYAPDQPAMYDEAGNVNNVVEVQEYVPENLDSLSGFDPPPSPPSRCRLHSYEPRLLDAAKPATQLLSPASKCGSHVPDCQQWKAEQRQHRHIVLSRCPAIAVSHSYNQPLPAPEDYTKEPPPAPQHLQLTLLNVPPAMDATASLPRPQHVVLNHTFCQRASHQVRSAFSVSEGGCRGRCRCAAVQPSI